ncbi:hypothetical protein XMD579_000204 [Marinobacterium sp. xm-d-579]|uniref:hypothetical protein n=1 Tax=Marinobacterium sp. xm-d-579 TaxID=2497734 RepID=UPI00156998DA|nr:hypothetical protein [Marinobacterium sp. xm-d-579]NRP35400.1 hypothetical protein [Marinobacterium sp. xm-d-579]
MRQLSITATDWLLQAKGDDWSLFASVTNRFNYLRLTLPTKEYLYAEGEQELGQSDRGVWVLGVFDHVEQLQYFLALHNDNPLKVPALKIEQSWPVVAYQEQSLMDYPHYSGVYRVGFKSYRVTQEIDGYRVEYIDGYKAALLGVLESEVDAFLALYSHFDSRTRGCKMC